jgi:hypothetical protein
VDVHQVHTLAPSELQTLVPSTLRCSIFYAEDTRERGPQPSQPGPDTPRPPESEEIPALLPRKVPYDLLKDNMAFRWDHDIPDDYFQYAADTGINSYCLDLDSWFKRAPDDEDDDGYAPSLHRPRDSRVLDTGPTYSCLNSCFKKWTV